MLRLLIISLLLIGCGPDFARKPSGHSGIDPDLQSLFDEWLVKMKDAQVDVSRLSIQHRVEYVDNIVDELNLKGDLVGLCVQDWEHWHIYVKTTKQDALRRVRLWHELGHCALDMPHTESPGQIMFPYIPDSTNYWDRLWTEAVETYIQEAKNPNE